MSATWRSRPRLAWAVRCCLVAVPVLLAVAVAAVVSRLLPGPYLLRLLAVLTAAAVTLWATERLGRRFLPLVTLLRLALTFPDQAPRRFRLALRAGSTRDLKTATRLANSDGAQQAAIHIVELLGALARHDRPTRRHSERVRAYTDLLAEALHVPETDRTRLRWASLIHDLGKITIHETVLDKPSALDATEWQLVRAHPSAGAEMAEGLREFLGPWFDTIEQHHERWDGSGYPYGLPGEQICLGARIVAVADSFEVMTAGRTYRAALSDTRGRQELVDCAGTQFDPRVVRAFVTLSLDSVTRWAAPWALVAAAPLAGPPPDVGLHSAAGIHPSAQAHAFATPSGHDASGTLHYTGHAHNAAGANGPDQH